MPSVDMVSWANYATCDFPPETPEGGIAVLANAIALQAVQDWVEAKRILKVRPKRKDMKQRVQDCERFFRSEYFRQITGANGCNILNKLCESFMTSPGKLYSVGMYGGKFMPMHKGHLHCLEEASRLCEKVYLICTVGGSDEDRIRGEAAAGKTELAEFITPEFRKRQIEKAAAMFPNVRPVMADLSSCRDKDGKEDWDMETPIILKACGEDFDAVFGSEPSYAPYFNRAYPQADYILVDTEREEVPISATKVRGMKIEKAKEWMV